MIKTIILLLLPICVSAQTFELRQVAMDTGNGLNDSLFIKVGSDSLYRHVGQSYIFVARQKAMYYTSANNLTGMTNYATTASLPNMSNYSLLNHNHTGVYQPVGSYLVAADITTKLNISDSAGMLNGYVRKNLPIGYGAGNGLGATITQATSKTTGVTINKICGQITMNAAALAAASEVTFSVINSTVASTDVIIVNVQSVGTAGAYLVSVGAVAAGSFSITVSNASAGSLSQAIVLSFSVIKSVSN